MQQRTKKLTARFKKGQKYKSLWQHAVNTLVLQVGQIRGGRRRGWKSLVEAVRGNVVVALLVRAPEHVTQRHHLPRRHGHVFG